MGGSCAAGYYLTTKEGCNDMRNHRKLDNLGRLVIPREHLETLGWSENTPLHIALAADGQGILLTPAMLICKLCGGAGDLLHSGEHLICRACVDAATGG